MYYISIVCNICLFFGNFLVNYTSIFGWFFKNRMQNQKNIPFWPRVHYIYVSNIGPCTFFAKKKEKEMQWKVSEKSSFHFWSANALIAFVTNVEYQDGKSPKEKLKGSLSWKNKNYFFHIFFFELLSSLDLWSNINYNQFCAL